jgi:serine protease Do
MNRMIARLLPLAPLPLALAASLFCLGPGMGRTAEPALQSDTTPLDRSARNVTSFAPVLKKIVPCVVTISTTRKMGDLSRRGSPLDDPMWRRFFGLDEEDESAAPRNRRPRRPREQEEDAVGSGVIVSADGYILSNSHVIDGADRVKVTLPDSLQELPARVVGADPMSDVAVLKIEGHDLPAATLTDSDLLQVGDVVLAVGNPFGVGQTITMGIVSGLRRRGMGIVSYEDFIQTDASINPGNSGGALVDAQGRLVGINTAILSRTGGNLGVGFAIPINMARSILEQLVKNGRVARGYLGVTLQPLTPQLERAFHLPDASGALVGDVAPGSPAQSAGLQHGDVVIELNGKKVLDNRHFRLLVSQTPPQTKVTLKLLREGKSRTASATLEELPAQLASNGKGAPETTPESPEEALQGVEVGDVGRPERRQFEIPTDVNGALVVKVEADSAAYEAGLREGDVILELNQQKIRNADDAVTLSKKVKEKSVLLRIWSKGMKRYLVVDEETKR